MFIDFTEVELLAGNGGKGSVHFRREKYIPKGGPDGGDGGRGGHIVFKADANLHTLQDVRYRRKYKADDGDGGGGSRKGPRHCFHPLRVQCRRSGHRGRIGERLRRSRNDGRARRLGRDGQSHARRRRAGNGTGA